MGNSGLIGGGSIVRIPEPQTKSPDATVLFEAHTVIGTALAGMQQLLNMDVAGADTISLCALVSAAVTALGVASSPVKRERLSGEILYSAREAIRAVLGDTAATIGCCGCDGGVMVAYTDSEHICDQCGATRPKQQVVA